MSRAHDQDSATHAADVEEQHSHSRDRKLVLKKRKPRAPHHPSGEEPTWDSEVDSSDAEPHPDRARASTRQHPTAAPPQTQPASSLGTNLLIIIGIALAFAFLVGYALPQKQCTNSNECERGDI